MRRPSDGGLQRRPVPEGQTAPTAGAAVGTPPDQPQARPADGHLQLRRRPDHGGARRGGRASASASRRRYSGRGISTAPTSASARRMQRSARVAALAGMVFVLCAWFFVLGLSRASAEKALARPVKELARSEKPLPTTAYSSIRAFHSSELPFRSGAYMASILVGRALKRPGISALTR